jgi:outer membrane lipopolysaccharide assembly protein LptE/RlpB
MKKVILGIILVTMLLSLTGCDWQVNYNLAEQIEFLPESGADQYVMSVRKYR